MASSRLKLNYVFTPSPNPIRASVGGSNPNTIDLQVLLSNPGSESAALAEIQIEIPVGSDSRNTLSTDPALPSPTYSASSGWSVTSSGGTVTLVPPEGRVTSIFVFEIQAIAVNDTPGVVPVTVTEIDPPVPKVVDRTSYALTKLPADFPVVNFEARPAVLFDLDQTATLQWACTEQGAAYVYSVHSDSWQPDDCVNGGTCFTCQDGLAGVTTPPLGETTKFALDVIATDPDGGRTIVDTLFARVRVETPKISGNSFVELFLFNRLARLHWLAFNASRCEVSLDGVVIDSQAPTDTYKHGYSVVVNGEPGMHQIAVTAYAESGPARALFSFPSFDVTATSGVKVGHEPKFVAIMPDGKLALVTKNDGVALIDLPSLAKEPDLASGTVTGALAVSPDGSLALVGDVGSKAVFVVDVVGRQVEPTRIPVGVVPYGLAFTPDGSLALMVSIDSPSARVIDVTNRRVEAETIPVGEQPLGVAVTPDGSLALVANTGSRSVTVIDVAGRRAEPKTIPTGESPMLVAVTPDGALALVTNQFTDDVTVINIATRTAEAATIPVGILPVGIAIALGGEVALVANGGSHDVTVIDIFRRRAARMTFAVGDSAFAIAVAPDGSLAVATNFAGDTVMVI